LDGKFILVIGEMKIISLMATIFTKSTTHCFQATNGSYLFRSGMARKPNGLFRAAPPPPYQRSDIFIAGSQI